MAYQGVILAFDLAGTTGVAEGCPGEEPRLSAEQFKRENETLLETCSRAQRFLMERVSAPRWIGDRQFGRGEAAAEGLIRVVIEAPINVPMKNRNNHSHGISLGLYTALGALALTRGVMVREARVNTVRKAFIGTGGLEGDLAKRSARMMCEALGWKPPNLDAADAAAVWWFFCREWNQPAAPLTEPLFANVAWKT